MSGRRIAAVARRIVEQFRHDRRTMAFLVGVPLVILTLIYYLFTPSGGTATAPIAIVNEDAGPAGGVLADGLAAAPSLDARRVSAREADALIRDGTVNAVVTFPSTFTQQAIQTRTLALGIELEGSDIFVNANTLGAIQKAVTESLAGALANLPGAAAGSGLKIDVAYLYGGADWGTLDYLGPVIIPFLAFFLIFVLTDVSFLRERASGTLERLLATPLQRSELVLGYLLGFFVFALLQTVILVLFALYVLGLKTNGSVAGIFIAQIAMVLVAVNLGLLLSAFARNEFQAVQFIPLVLLPQLLLSGILIPIQSLPDLLRPLAWLMPLTYVNEASRAVMVKGAPLTDQVVVRDLGALLLLALVLAFLASRTIRREVA